MATPTPTPTNPIERLDVPVADVLADLARKKRARRVERAERKRFEHIRGHLPLDDPDRHDLDVVDTNFARLAANWSTS